MFQSFFMGGFECSTHRGRHRYRHDLVAATRHDRFAAEDYRRLRKVGITTVREGLRWHLIEPAPERYDFSSVLPILRAAQTENMQVVWDIFHYGFPDDINPFEADFLFRFGEFAYAFAEFLKIETDETTPFVCPFNEISFYSYAAGERGFFAPYGEKRGDELKSICVRAAIEATKAMQTVFPDARFAQIEPLIHVVGQNDSLEEQARVEDYRQSQFAAWDMIAGRTAPELGGAEEFLDVIGVNYYWYNQWILADDPTEPGETIKLGTEKYRPFHEILLEVYERYQRPIFVAETGTENDERALWLRYICDEVKIAQNLGVPIEGICWYPILNHPGWDDDRHCHNGLWDYCDEAGCRTIYQPLAEELEMQRARFEHKRTVHDAARTAFVTAW